MELDGADIENSRNQHESKQDIKIYHERQSRQLCALHALNNLLQKPQTFTKQDLDAICKQLAPDFAIFNPHKSVFGLGCYDVNVIIAAMSERGYDVAWFDKRKDVSNLNLDGIFGFILNIPNDYTEGLMSYLPSQARIWSSQKHWIGVRKVGDYYYNLDSKFKSPECLGNVDGLVEYLNQQKSIDQVEILIVVSKSVSESGAWLKVK